MGLDEWVSTRYFLLRKYKDKNSRSNMTQIGVLIFVMAIDLAIASMGNTPYEI